MGIVVVGWVVGSILCESSRGAPVDVIIVERGRGWVLRALIEGLLTGTPCILPFYSKALDSTTTHTQGNYPRRLAGPLAPSFLVSSSEILEYFKPLGIHSKMPFHIASPLCFQPLHAYDRRSLNVDVNACLPINSFNFSLRLPPLRLLCPLLHVCCSTGCGRRGNSLSWRFHDP